MPSKYLWNRDPAMSNGGWVAHSGLAPRRFEEISAAVLRTAPCAQVAHRVICGADELHVEFLPSAPDAAYRGRRCPDTTPLDGYDLGKCTVAMPSAAVSEKSHNEPTRSGSAMDVVVRLAARTR
jgi:hypothetical protein